MLDGDGAKDWEGHFALHRPSPFPSRRPSLLLCSLLRSPPSSHAWPPPTLLRLLVVLLLLPLLIFICSADTSLCDSPTLF